MAIALNNTTNPKLDTSHHDNNILTRAAGGRVPTRPEFCWKGVVLMYVTWSDLIAFVAMITGIIALTIKIHKK